MKIAELIKQVGTPYEMFWDDGNYKGCFYPMYFLYPDLPRYPLPNPDVKNYENFKFGIKKILKDFDRIEKKDIEAGDLIACQFNNELHVGIILEKDKLIHVFRGHRLQIDRLSFFKNRFLTPLFFRKKKK